MNYIVGQAISLAVIVTQNDPVTGLPVLDGSGNAVRLDDASMAVTVYKPNGTTVTPSVTRVSLGVYTAQVTPSNTEGGEWEYAFQGVTTAPGRGRGIFWVAAVP